VTDLKPEELTIKEDGIPQQISDFSLSTSAGDDPILVAILIDTSVSMNEKYKGLSKINMAKDAASLLLSQLKPQDKRFLVTFSEVPAEATHLTSAPEETDQTVKQLKTNFLRTALLDAISLVTKKLKDEWGRKLIFICSDGEDNASTQSQDKVLEEVKSAFDTTVVSLGTTAFENDLHWFGEEEEIRKGKALLQSLAESSGGYAFFPSNLKELGTVMQKLRDLIPSQYFLGYHPVNPKLDGSWRNIEITCSRKGVKLQYRKGYFAR
jgi:VWFA-related protein